MNNLIHVLKAKLHRVTITECDINYNGSISMDSDFINKANLFPNEKVEIYNINNGTRFSTYVIPATKGSKKIAINGAAARLAEVGDIIIICAYMLIPEANALTHTPQILCFEGQNKIINK